MPIICPICNEENPTKANFCMFCNTQLIEEEQLSEEDRLRKKIAELEEQKKLREEKENLEKKLLETERKKLEEEKKKLEEERLAKKLQETERKEKDAPKQQKTVETPPPANTTTVTETASTNNSSKKKLIIVLFIILVVVFGNIIYFVGIKPAIIDKNAQRYYSFVNSVNFRSSKDAGGDYNKIGSVPYGAEIITYKYDSDWTYGKHDKKKGYISSGFLLNKKDFVRLNSIWGDVESKECIGTAKCRIALLNYFKEKDYIGKIAPDVLAETLPFFSANNDNQWQIFCRNFKLKPNNVFYPKIHNKNSKFTDFAVIIKNINTGQRRLLIFYFDDDETPHLYSEKDIQNPGYITNITKEYNPYEEKYYIDVKFSK